MRPGRPVGSDVRNNIATILHYMKKGYGYNIYRTYLELFPRVSLRLIYYHLRKGVDLEEFRIHAVEKEKGEYSWGAEAEKTYYSIGKNGVPSKNAKAREYFRKKGAKLKKHKPKRKT